MRPMGSTQHVPRSRSLRFDEYDPEWDLGQSPRHLNLCFLLRELLLRAVTPNDTVGMDAFLYFDEEDAHEKCAPDAFVKLGVPDARYTSWKTWQKGAPELCVEILSPSDTRETLTQAEKLERFETMGVGEVVFFDVDEPEGTRLRAWDRVAGKLVPRVIEHERTECKTLNRWFHVGRLDKEPAALVLAADEAGNGRILTHEEAARVAEEGRRFFEAKWIAEAEARAAAENARRAAENARRAADDAHKAAEARAEAAEARSRELEALLRSKQTPDGK
ncbi:hypothetical protein BH09MYX1_BH09MYX1_65530 [soil metagenome]